MWVRGVWALGGGSVSISCVCLAVFLCVWWCSILAVFVGCVGFTDHIRVLFVVCMVWCRVFLSRSGITTPPALHLFCVVSGSVRV